MQNIILTLIIFNSILLGISIDNEGFDSDGYLEYIFTAIFTMEVILKIFGLGNLFWIDGWNIFDFIVVTASLVEVVVTAVLQTDVISLGLSAIRLFRVFRVLRVAGRLTKINVLIQAVLHSLQSVVWVAILLFIMLYVCGVLATNLFGRNKSLLKAIPLVDEWWGSVPRSMGSLFQVITMDSWTSQMARPMGLEQPWTWICMIFFVMLIGLGFLNLLAAIFVDSLLEMKEVGARESIAIKHNQEKLAHRNLERLFMALDKSNSGSISTEEMRVLMTTLRDERWVAMLREIDISPEGMEDAVTRFYDQAYAAAANAGTSWNAEMHYQDFLDMYKKVNEPAGKQDVWRAHHMINGVQSRLGAVEARLRQQSDMLDFLAEKQGYVPKVHRSSSRGQVDIDEIPVNFGCPDSPVEGASAPFQRAWTMVHDKEQAKQPIPIRRSRSATDGGSDPLVVPYDLAAASASVVATELNEEASAVVSFPRSKSSDKA